MTCFVESLSSFKGEFKIVAVFNFLKTHRIKDCILKVSGKTM